MVGVLEININKNGTDIVPHQTVKQFIFIALLLVSLIATSWTDPSTRTAESEGQSDSIQIELSCPLVLDIGIVFKDTTVTIDCIVTNRESTALILNFSEGFGFRVPEYTQYIPSGLSGVIKFRQPITEPGKFTKSWNFEMMNGDKKQFLTFVIKGERKE